MSDRFVSLLVTAAAACISLPTIAHAQQDVSVTQEDVKIGAKQYSPYLYRGHPNRVFWGDTHLHTSYSTDAGMIGNTLGPEVALRFAKGEKVISSTGVPARLIAPLDFLVVADHSENLGLAVMIEESDAALLRDPWGKRAYDLVKSGDNYGAYKMWGEEGVATGNDPMPNPTLQKNMWSRVIDAVDKANQPGVFTAFHGFEWTSVVGAKNLHRVVIFRDGKDRVQQVLPLSVYDTADPEKLWDYLDSYEKKTGGQVLAIPHNGNLSNGLMFAIETQSGNPIDAAYAERRMQWEPIYEVTQGKGDGEAHPKLSPNDEFADFHTWDKGDFGFEAKTPGMLPYEYARSALMIGLEQAAMLGVNPFMFGMIGSTDSHTSLATTREENYFGKFAGVEPGTKHRYDDDVVTDRRPDGDGSLQVQHWETTAGALAAVWATENTREALWDAMKRKEVYATTGTRILVRVFAGWDFEAPDVQRPDFADIGYQNGVPMGGDLPAASNGKAPKLIIRALRDANGANLDRIQIIKGWLTMDGKSVEKIYDVACSDGRKITDKNRCDKPVGETVDLETATYTNSIGDAVLTAFWEDPEFDPKQRAFYYVRILEIPTPTWLAYDKVKLGTNPPAEGVYVHQERAYTSPIWYTPKG